METELNEINRFMVGVSGDDKIKIMNPQVMLPMSKAAALNLASYLVCLADPEGTKFSDMLKRAQS